MLEQALALLREGKITRAKAAELAGVSIYEIIELAAKQGIPISYDKEDLEQDLRTLRELHRK
jgi:predicted HTH domain antitoxin